MKYMRCICLLAAGAGLLAVTAAGSAAGLPSGYPQSFDFAGTIDGIEMTADTIVIDDRTLVLRRDARLHGPRGSMDRSALRKGMTVGVRHDMQGERMIIRDLWLLPDGLQP